MAPADAPHPDVVAALADDLNTPSVISILFGIAKSAKRGNGEQAAALRASLEFLGLYAGETRDDLMVGLGAVEVDADKVEALIAARQAARKGRDFAEADRLRDELTAMGVQLFDGPDGTTWEVMR